MEVKNCDLTESELPACSVEWLQKRKQLVVGCYELVDGSTSERRGQMQFYSLNEQNKLTLGIDFKSSLFRRF